MDPNNQNQTNTFQSTTPQLDTTQQPPMNVQPNTPLQSILDQQPTPAAPAETPITNQNTYQIQEPVAQANPNPQINSNPQTDIDTPMMDEGYVEDIGGGIIDLLDDINEKENLLEIVADEMELDKERVKGTLAKLLDKIDQEQITSEEIALIMASTIVDEASNKE